MLKRVMIVILVLFLTSGAYALDSGNESESVRVIVNLENMASVELNESEILALEEDGSEIYYDFPIEMQLVDSRKVIGIPYAEEHGLNGSSQTVCVVDTGVYYKNPDLGGCFGSGCKVIAGWDFVNNDSNPEDDNGHGTHVAGIVAASGNLKGIAFESRIVAVKVLDSKGSGLTSGVLKGIQYCIEKAEEYNITAITLSLATNCEKNPGSCSKSFCDDSAFYPYIKEAKENNISVIAATGNAGLDLIASPACVSPAIRSGASGKDDSFLEFTNKNPGLKLLAPGGSINSLGISGNAVKSGTSMSVPHIAAGILIINEYLHNKGESKSPEELENILYDSGKKISFGEFTFSRIDIENALVFLSGRKAEIILKSPGNNSVIPGNISFECNVKNYTTLDSRKIKVWNLTWETTSENNSIMLEEGSYAWNCYAHLNGSIESAGYNNTFIVNNSYSVYHEPETIEPVVTSRPESGSSGGGGGSGSTKNKIIVLNDKEPPEEDIPVYTQDEIEYEIPAADFEESEESRIGITGLAVRELREAYEENYLVKVVVSLISSLMMVNLGLNIVINKLNGRKVK